MLHVVFPYQASGGSKNRVIFTCITAHTLVYNEERNRYANVKKSVRLPSHSLKKREFTRSCKRGRDWKFSAAEIDRHCIHVIACIEPMQKPKIRAKK